MIGPNNWVRVKCAKCPEEFIMHWPCQGSEEQCRNGVHLCGNCEIDKCAAVCESDPVRRYPVKNLEFDPQDREGY
jgi:hypothetical protein